MDGKPGIQALRAWATGPMTENTGYLFLGIAEGDINTGNPWKTGYPPYFIEFIVRRPRMMPYILGGDSERSKEGDVIMKVWSKNLTDEVRELSNK